jgi:hypothetical protein
MPHRGGGDLPVERQRLARLLEGRELARVAPRLPPEVLHRLIRHAGLDHCVENESFKRFVGDMVYEITSQ